MLLNLGADLIAIVHISYFLFVLGGTVAIITGYFKGWEWVRGPWFRFLHLIAIYIVLFEEVTSIPCVLNLLQWSLRSEGAGEREITEGFGGVLDQLLYHTIAPVTLDIFYWSMGIWVLLLFWCVPVRLRRAFGYGNPVYDSDIMFEGLHAPNKSLQRTRRTVTNFARGKSKIGACSPCRCACR